MEQGAARERATERPYPPSGDSARVPEQARGAEQARSSGQGRSAQPGRSAEQARGEHTHGERTHGAHAHGERTHGESAASRPAPVPVPAPRPVQRHSVRDQILEALRTALVGGELVPGEVYSGPALAERFGVSATPVREAMQRLAVEGAVEVVPNRGFRVTERTPRELAELAEVRALIEVPVMLRLARTVPAARWAELRPLAEATGAAAARGDRAHYAETDRAFHRAVLALAGNEQLLAIADDLHRRSQWPLISAPALRHGELVADAAEHTALLDALIAQDLPVVQSLVREHFAGSEY
ncbi:GntR family transcriptional regulator [Streptomyces sp. WAC01280]|uniref:GntR family transcriptional regulator n=1 Tax=Streptomyces sp. WAC01280 TaxID=2487424 RepID=UPI000F785F0F|nr:GntR family transcriptional regulator [Streptomyces sp. WAC01280]RSS59878.1 GntR family transcriptional regulator [Streptomyces sp. WAC01280]